MTEVYSGFTPEEVAFIIGSPDDEGFDLLEATDRWAVERGEARVLLNSGIARPIERQENKNESKEVSVFQTTTVEAGTFPWITEDYDAPFEEVEVDGRQIRLIDISEADKKLARLGKRLNGSSGRADIAVRQRVSESMVNGGVVAGAQPFIDKPNFPTILSLESGDNSNSKKVRVFFTLPSPDNDVAYKVAACSFGDQKKTETRLKQLQS